MKRITGLRSSASVFAALLLAHDMDAGQERLWRPGTSGSPRTADIRQAQIFEQPLLPTSEASPAENQALAQALQQFSRRAVRDDFSSVAAFLESYPDSAWSLALETQLGSEYYRVGRYSKAIGAWRHAWESGKSATGEVSGALANQAGSRLAMMYARLGRIGELRSLLAELEARPGRGKRPRELRGATEGLWSMQHQPEVSFRCGPLALDRICSATDRAKAGNKLIQQSQSTTNGFSALQVAALSRALGMNYQVAFRSAGAEVILPSVVHWKVGHFAALIARDGLLIRADDPTFGNKTWLSDEALDDEASGYFLVRSGALPRGWRAVSDADAANVWGKGTTLKSDPDSTTEYDPTAHSCAGGSGMASWDISLLLASTHVEDTPVGYTPPVGPPIYFKVYYDDADAQGLMSVPYSNVAPDWRMNWLAWVTDDPMNPVGDVRFAADGGGALTFTDFNPTNQVFQNLFRNRADLVRTSTNSYELRYPDGSKKIFDLPDGQVGTTRNIYMTAVVDPTGNAATVQFDFPGRIATITDAIGQQTRLLYNFVYSWYMLVGTVNPYFITNCCETNGLLMTGVVDPFGRTATFQVDSATNFEVGPGQQIVSAAWAHLTNITDAIGLSSSFSYSGIMDTLTTPYGQTHFAHGSYNGIYRANWVEVTYPNGEKERVEYSEKTPAQIFSSEPLSIVPKGVPVRNYILWARNTYYWDRNAYAQGYSPNDYTGARIYHWTHGLDYNTASPILESAKAPLEHRVWFNYDGQVSPTFAGTSDQPTTIARTLEDGTTQLYQFEYNSLNNATKAIDPLGREMTFLYDTNGVDLIEVRQTRAGQNELLLSATYNSHHRPLTIAGPDRQTNQFTYNTRGQVLTATNPRGDTMTYSYDANGYLLAIDGPLPGTNDTSHFVYDGVGRLHTAIDVDGYTLTFDYDDADRLTRITYPDATYEEIVYDRLDPSVLRDRAGRQTRLTFDPLRQLVAVQDPMGRTTLYNWCGCGSLEAVIDPMGRMTRWMRDLQGRVTAKVYADGSQIQCAYDTATGWLKTVRDEQNQVTKFDYNLDGTLRAKSYLNPNIPTPAVKFTYDSNYLRVLTMEDGVGLTTYSYYPVTGNASPGAGRLATIDGPFANDTLTFEYDELGREAVRAINGAAIRRSWDAAGRLTRMTNVLGIFLYSWDGNSSRLAALDLPNGQRSTFSYFPNLKDQLPQQITHWMSDSTVLSRFTYDYDAVRQITQLTHETNGAPAIQWMFGYDATDQLTNAAATQNGASVASYIYTYDRAENRVAEQSPAGTRQLSHNTLNELASISGPEFSPVNLEWDAEHRLVSVTDGVNGTQLSYDGLNRCVRIVETTNGITVSDKRFVWRGTRLWEERDSSGTQTLKRFFSRGVQVASGADLPPGAYFYTQDHLGSIREMTDIGGIVHARYTYEPFGTRTRIEGNDDADFGFTGHYFLRSRGLHLALFRAYDSRVGRWLGRDRLGELDSENLYAYASNDPINRTDALGLWSPAAHDLIIQNAFHTRLSPADIQVIQKASRDFDSRTQGELESAKHSMRRSGQTPKQAIGERDFFVNKQIAEARQAARCGKRAEALRLFGEAIHPVMDKSSPMHVSPNGDPEIWINPIEDDGFIDLSGIPGAIRHGWNDTFISGEAVGDVTPQIAAQQAMELNNLYNQVFGP